MITTVTGTAASISSSSKVLWVRLFGCGDMLVKLTGQVAQRVHGVLIGPDDIAQAIGAAKRKGT